MKSALLLATAVAALASPALAQNVGSFGAAYQRAEADVAGLEAEADGVVVDGVVAIPVSAEWTVTLDGDLAFSDSDGDDDTSISGVAHLTRTFGADVRAGGFVGAADAGGDTAWTVGAEAQRYLAAATLTGVVAYTTVDDVDVWTVGGDAGVFITPNFRLNAGLSYSDLEADGIGSADAWSYGLGGEHQFANTPFSLTAGYTRTDIEDLEVDTFSIGLRYSFGGDLKARDRAGANLTGAGVVGLLSAL